MDEAMSSDANQAAMPGYQAILQQIAELEAQATKVRQGERMTALNQVLDLMRHFNLSIKEVRAGKIGPEGSKQASSKMRAPPMYRDPNSGATWSGRGRKPAWLAEALNGGASLDSFKI